MNTIFVEEITKPIQIITGENFKYLSQVHREKNGNTIVLKDGNYNIAEAKILEINKKEIRAEILNLQKVEKDENYFHLLQGLPKNKKLDLITQKLTELGIHEISPFISDYSVADKLSENKIERLKKISKEAARQSERNDTVKINPVKPIKEILNNINADLIICAYENEESFTLKDIQEDIKESKNIIFIIGPEGGFSPDEIKQFREKDIKIISLGKNILRTETAGLVLLSQILYVKQ